MKEYRFEWRRQFFNPFRYGVWRKKIIVAKNIKEACKQMRDSLAYFNVEVSRTVIVNGKEKDASKLEFIEHLISATGE